MSYQASIDWLWNNNDSPQQLRCTGYMVAGGTVPVPRGFTTGNGCVRHCIEASRGGNPSLAINWLMAGQCHNDDARNELAQNAEAAVKYAVDVHGGG